MTRRSDLSDTRRSRFLLTGIVLTCALTLNVLGFKLESGALIVLASVVLVIRTESAISPEWLVGPGTFLCLHHAGAYVVGPLGQTWLLGSMTRNIDVVTRVQWAAALGLGTWAIVYPIVFRGVVGQTRQPRIARGLDVVNTANWDRFALTLLPLGIGVLVYQRLAGITRLGSAGTSTLGENAVFAAFQHIPSVALFFLAYLAARRRGLWFLLWGVAITLFGLWTLLDGGRTNAFIAACFSGCALYLGGVRKSRLACGALALAVIMIPVAGVVERYRDTYGGASSVHDRVQGFSAATASYAMDGSDGNQKAAAFLKRIAPGAVDRVFWLTPEVRPYVGLRDFGRLLYVYVPTFLMPTRQDLIDGNEICIEYGAAPAGSSGNSMSVVGDGYRRFGWAGVVLLYALIASCSAGIVGMVRRSRGKPEWVATMLVLLINLNGETGLSTFLGTFYSILWVLPKYFMFFTIIGLTQKAISPHRWKPLQNFRDLSVKPCGLGDRLPVERVPAQRPI